ncbi:MAG: glycosyltransferase family 2 protein [Acidimicrobiales bacterium]
MASTAPPFGRPGPRAGAAGQGGTAGTAGSTGAARDVGWAERLPAPAKLALRRYPGKLPAYRLALAARRAPQAVALGWVERREAQRALCWWGRRPAASVVTVVSTYRRPARVQRAVASALAQSWRDHVVLVIDDGAGLPPLPADPRLFTYSLSQRSASPGLVRNVGIRASASRWLAFLDDDNEWRPDHLSCALQAHDQGAELTYAALERVDEAGTVLDVLSVPFERRRLRERAFVDTSSIVVARRSSVRFARAPHRRGEFPLEDWALAYRLSRTLCTVHIPVPTVRYLVHEGSRFTDWGQVGLLGGGP